MPVRLSTKDQLKAMGIHVGMYDDVNISDGSIGDGASAGYDDLDINALESEDDDLQEQDQFKGVNLNPITKVHRRYETRAERRVWLDDDGNQGKYNIAMNQRPKKEEVENAVKRHRDRVTTLQAYTKTNDT